MSENDWKRIQQFAARPRHQRDPDLLVPEPDDGDAREENTQESAAD
jgi:hypothetical protein